MPNYYVPLAAPQVQNAMLNFQPLNSALDQYRDQSNQNAMLQQRQGELDYQHGRDAKQDARVAEQDSFAKIKRGGEMAMAIGNMADTDPAKASAWQNYLKSFGDGDHSPEELDFRTGPKIAAAAAGQFLDPRDSQMKDLELQNSRAGIALKQAQIVAAQRKGSPELDQRVMDLQRFGINPESPEGKSYIFNGTMPPKAYENNTQAARSDGITQNIENALANISSFADKYDDASFSNAAGPIQGSQPDGLLSAIPVNAARLGGEIMNWAEGGKTAPSEVRSNIIGSTEALAASIKPLIRKPGEGTWTDADQARLVAIVGDLSQSRTKDEYRRRLHAIRDRLNSSFGLDVRFGEQPQAGKPQAQPDWQSTFKRVD